MAAVESTLPVTVNAIDARVAATAEIGQSIRRGMIALRIVDGIVRNVYEINIGKLALPISPSPRLLFLCSAARSSSEVCRSRRHNFSPT